MRQEAIETFRQLVRNGKIYQCVSPMPNMDFPTLGGNFFWDDICSCQGWKIQKNSILGYCRLLDENNIRSAWGSESEFENMFLEADKAKSSALDEFVRLVNAGSLESRLNSQASTNLEISVADAGICWDDLCVCHGYKLQKHKLFGNCRILNPSGVRLAWGSREYVFRRIKGEVINAIAAYCSSGNHFYHYSAADEPGIGLAILIHGWGVTADRMSFMAKGCSLSGYDTYSYDYRSSLQDIPHLAADLFESVKSLLSAHRSGKVYFLTHSMGGLLLRQVLALDANNEISGRIGEIVMLTPPNKGSLMADLAAAAGIDALNASVGDMKKYSDSFVKHIGEPVHYHKTIGIVGGTMDGTVEKDSLGISGISCDIKMIHAFHSGICKSPEALELALSYFRNGKFD